MLNKDILAYRRIFVGMKSMKILRVFLNILAGLLLLLGGIALFQAFAAPATRARIPKRACALNERPLND
jgi:hypothetical protein